MVRRLTLVALVAALLVPPACDPEGDGDADADVDGDADMDADTDIDVDADTDVDSDADGDADTDSDADGDADADADGGVATFAELCAQPGVVFCDDFEGSWDDAWTEDGGDVRIIDGQGVVGEGANVVELATYGGQQSSKLIYVFPDAEEIYVRFDVMYDEDYDNSGGSHGPILGGSSSPPWGILGTAGIRPSGDDHFVLNFEPRGVVGDGGEFAFYAYFVNMTPDGHGDYWGKIFSSELDPPPAIRPGLWQCVEYGLTLNTAGDNDDGRADFWVDGVHHGSFGGFQWRTAAELRANTFILDSYNHFRDGALPESSPNLVRYDNLVVSTEPVGCISMPGR